MNAQLKFNEVYQGYTSFLRNTYPFQYFGCLDDSIIYCKRRASKHFEVENAVEIIWKTLPAEITTSNKKSILEKRKKAIENIICNLLRALYRKEVVAIPMSGGKYYKLGIYKLYHPPQIPKIVHVLKDTGWINFARGFNDWDSTTKNRYTRIWMTEKMINLFSTIHPIEDITQKYEEPIILRNSDKEDIPYKDNGYSNKLRKFLNRYNLFMDNLKVEYTPLEEPEKVENPYFEEFDSFSSFMPQCKSKITMYKNYYYYRQHDDTLAYSDLPVLQFR
jgi:hypothetical protein